MKIGFWGAGLMGSGLCRTLLKNGHEVWVYSRDLERARELASSGPNGHVCTAQDDLARGDVLISCVARPLYLKESFLDEQGLKNRMIEGSLYSHMRKGSLHIECSTIDPVTAQTLAREAEQRGIDYLQATLGKTPVQAAKAQEPMFVGGAKAVKEKAWPLLEEIGLPLDVGSVEASCAAKLISNLVGMTNIAVLAEGFKVGCACGLDPTVLLNLLKDTGAHSFQMDVRGPMLAADNYDDVKFRLTLALKDLTLGTEMAHVKDVSVPFFDAALSQFQHADECGLGAFDCAAVGQRKSE